MSTIVSSADLQLRIAAMEVKCRQQEDDLKNTAGLLLESLTPANLIRNTLRNTIQAPGFGTTVLKGAAGLALGFVTKKMFVKSSSGLVKKALGSLVELGVAKVVAKNAGKIVGFRC